MSEALPKSEHTREAPKPPPPEAREFSKALALAEKNSALYPPGSRVVERSLDTLHQAAHNFLKAAGRVVLDVKQSDLLFNDQSIYHEEDKGRSIAFRLFKDGVRQLILQPGLEREELEVFLACLREAAKTQEEEEDFATIFWEKDLPHMHVQLADDVVFAEDVPEIPERKNGLGGHRLNKFQLEGDEEKRLEEALENRSEEGSNEFEITSEEAAEIRRIVEEEDSYLALFDFVDILLELIVRRPEGHGFERALDLIRTVFEALLADGDYGRAALLVEKLRRHAHPELKDEHRRRIDETLVKLADGENLEGLKRFLEENPRLPKDHEVFKFLRSLPAQAAAPLCNLLECGRHMAALKEVLESLGKGSPEVFARWLSHPDASVAAAAADLVLATAEKPTAKLVAASFAHPSEDVRVHAARRVLELDDPESSPLFLNLLKGDSRQLLNLALQYFAMRSAPEAFEVLEELSRSRVFCDLDDKRQTLCFKALLRASPERALDYLERRVLAWRFTWGKNAKRRKAAALHALESAPPARARAILERFAALRRGVLARAARRSLQGLALMEARMGEGAGRKARKVEVQSG